jgi:hypothetical protein
MEGNELKTKYTAKAKLKIQIQKIGRIAIFLPENAGIFWRKLSIPLIGI